LTAPSLFKRRYIKRGERILGLEGGKLKKKGDYAAHPETKIRSAYPGILKQPLLDLFLKAPAKDFEGHL